MNNHEVTSQIYESPKEKEQVVPNTPAQGLHSHERATSPIVHGYAALNPSSFKQSLSHLKSSEQTTPHFLPLTLKQHPE